MSPRAACVDSLSQSVFLYGILYTVDSGILVALFVNSIDALCPGVWTFMHHSLMDSCAHKDRTSKPAICRMS